ncbi:MAG: FAD-dependent thymidylate synthase [Patescibacteria group bacterium]|nr:MAG: FAD-dependent thymidylate synthase [Patescibacteria group bacterium]
METKEENTKKRFVTLAENLDPQDSAMLQALYSRSSDSVTTHLEKVREKGSGNFMNRFYVGYGHGSIGDCGTITLFIENVSILAAKAIQDWPLYSGQETSTRYIDMAKQPLEDPLKTQASSKLLKDWMDFYVKSQEPLKEYLRGVYPRQVDEEEKTYDKALSARVFDTLRSFLPAGICTQLSWHTNLRQAAEKLALLNHHPLEEVRSIAEEITEILKEKYPESFSHKTYPEQEVYRAKISELYTYYHNPSCPVFKCESKIDSISLETYKEVLVKRPIKTNLPTFLSELGSCLCDFLLDYGSSRDAQRHRNGVFRMPLLTTEIGFHQWYLNELSPELREKALTLIETQVDIINKLEASLEIKQYYIPMGFLVSCRTTYSLPQMVYVTELRSDKTVHPTYREVAHKMHQSLKDNFPYLTLYSDTDPSNWDIRRGKQDIALKEQG